MLFVLPLIIVIGKCFFLPTSGLFLRVFSLTDIPKNMQNRVVYILFVPFGATLVVFFRLVLGIRILGPFRSILIAVAFQITGILHGLFFLAAVISIVVIIRPIAKAIRLPYFARVSVILSTVASIMIIVLLCSELLHIEWLSRLVYFPIVVLCLTGEGFARTLSIEGVWSAAWRGIMTVLIAILITLLSQINGLRNLFLYFPELLIMQIGCIIVMAEFFDLRLLARLNTGAVKNRSSIRATKVSSSLKQEADESTLRSVPYST